MKYKCIYTTFILILVVLNFSCTPNSKNNELRHDHLYGKWICRIIDGEYIGIDTLIFNSDLKFKDSQSLSYRSSDSGFDFSTKFNLNIGGTWKLKSDSIYICYDLGSFILNIDPETFSIKTSDHGADTTRLKDLRNDMQEDLSRHLNNTFKTRYGNISNEEVFLGRVTYLDLDSMIISNNGNSLTLHRVLK